MSGEKTLGQIGYEAEITLIEESRGDNLLSVPWADADEDAKELSAAAAKAVAERCAQVADQRARMFEDGRAKQSDPILKHVTVLAQAEAENIAEEIRALLLINGGSECPS